MRIERLTYNKIKIFLTTDDLTERGLTKEDIWKDSLKWHQLFHDMLEEASDEFGVIIEGSVAVEIFSVHSQGMIMIVTVEEEDDEALHEGFIDMAITEQKQEEILFEFENFEHVIHLSKRLNSLQFLGGSLYSIENKYFLSFSEKFIQNPGNMIAIMAEFGNPSLASVYWLEEYGKKIIENKAVETLVKYF